MVQKNNRWSKRYLFQKTKDKRQKAKDKRQKKSKIKGLINETRFIKAFSIIYCKYYQIRQKAKQNL